MLNRLARLTGFSTDDLVIIILAIGLPIGIGVLALTLSIRRMNACFRHLKGLGLTVMRKGSTLAASPGLEWFHGNPLLKEQRSTVRWRAFGRWQERDVDVFQYWFVTGHAKHRKRHPVLVAAVVGVSTPHDITVARKRVFGPKGVVTLPPGSSPMAGDLAIFAASDQAVLTLPPALQQLLAALPPKVWVRLNGGVLCIGREGDANAARIDEVLALADQAARAM